jgi:hypothetical protein
VLVLLPEFVADDEFGWLVAPWDDWGSVVDVSVVVFPTPPDPPPGPALAAATEMSAATANAAAIAVLCLNKRFSFHRQGAQRFPDGPVYALCDTAHLRRVSL